jgi:hypothetical protein
MEFLPLEFEAPEDNFLVSNYKTRTYTGGNTSSKSLLPYTRPWPSQFYAVYYSDPKAGF